jgi:hypothetical protein
VAHSSDVRCACLKLHADSHDLLQARGIYDKVERARLVKIAFEEQVTCATAGKPESMTLPGVETLWTLKTPGTEDDAKFAIQQVSRRLLELAALLGAQPGENRSGTGADPFFWQYVMYFSG